MTIDYQFVDEHGTLIRAQAASLEAEHQSVIRDVLAAGDFWVQTAGANMASTDSAVGSSWA